MLPLIVILKVHKSLYFVTSLLLARNFLLASLFSFQGADLVRTDSVSFLSAFRRNLIHFIVLPLPRKPAYAGLCSDLGDVFLIQDQIETLHCCKMLQSKLGGDNRNRTDDPLLARQVLSQLSYTPASSQTLYHSFPSFTENSLTPSFLLFLANPFHWALLGSWSTLVRGGGPKWTRTTDLTIISRAL